jgi:glycosyltransferase involved in cell wall biosynthesis
VTGNRIRAALLGTRGVPAKYGAFEYAADRIATMGGKGSVDWTIYCPSAPDLKPVHGNADLEGVPHGDGASSSLWYDLRCLWHACHQDYTVIFMLGYGAGLGLLLPRLFGKVVITNTNGFEYKRGKWPWYAKLYFRYAEAAAALSSTSLISDSIHVASYYKRRYGKKSTFIAYGTDVPADKALEASKLAFGQFMDRYRLCRHGYHVVVMRMEPENSIKSIIDAGLEGEQTLPILLIGPSTPFFEKITKDIPADSRRVIVAGPIYDRGLLFLLRKNACSYVHGHTVGGINPTILEALSTDTPVIARDTLFNREVLEDAGLYFTASQELARQMARVETLGPLQWQQQAQMVAGKQRPAFTWEYVVQEYERLAVECPRS